MEKNVKAIEIETITRSVENEKLRLKRYQKISKRRRGWRLK